MGATWRLWLVGLGASCYTGETMFPHQGVVLWSNYFDRLCSKKRHLTCGWSILEVKHSDTYVTLWDTHQGRAWPGNSTGMGRISHNLNHSKINFFSPLVQRECCRYIGATRTHTESHPHVNKYDKAFTAHWIKCKYPKHGQTGFSKSAIFHELLHAASINSPCYT